MSITAIVENDTIKLPVHIPDGTRVEVTVSEKAKQTTAGQFRDWWETADELSLDEAESFVSDIEAGRRQMNQPAPDPLTP